MSYPIWIGHSSNGNALIGAQSINAVNGTRTEQVYASQLPHRVVARDQNGKLVVTTPTDAKQKKMVIVDKF